MTFLNTQIAIVMGELNDQDADLLVSRAPSGTGVPINGAQLSADGDRLAYTNNVSWKGGQYGEMVDVERTFRSALELGVKTGARSLACWPIGSTSTDAHFPADRSAYVVFNTLTRFLSKSPDAFDQVSIVVANDDDATGYGRALQKVLATMVG